MADSTLHDDIRDMRDSLIELVKGQARTEQKIDGLDKRLYDGGAGAIPVLFQKFEGMSKDTATQNGALASAITSVNNRVDNQRAWVAGAAAVATIFLGGAKYALGKIGIHIP
jgi:hemoglobin-like flavoprotein